MESIFNIKSELLKIQSSINKSNLSYYLIIFDNSLQSFLMNLLKRKLCLLNSFY